MTPITFRSPAEEYAAVYEWLQHCRLAGQGQVAGILEARLKALGEGLITPLPATKGRMAKTAARTRKLVRSLRRPACLMWYRRVRPWSR